MNRRWVRPRSRFRNKAIYRVVELESSEAAFLTTLPCFFLVLVTAFEELVVVTPLASVADVAVADSVALLLPWS